MDEQLLARLESLENRLESIESSLNTINRELGILCGKVYSNSRVPLLIRWVIFPLILIVGGLVGIKLYF